MSALCLVEFSGKKLEFTELNNLANEVIANALLNKYSVFFNDDYAKQILKPEAHRHTILLSRSFFDRNADELFDVTDFVSESEIKFKEKFLDNFSFLNQIFDILFRYQIDGVNIYFTDDSETNLNEYIYLEVIVENLLERLYETFIRYCDTTGYSFPDIKMHIEKE